MENLTIIKNENGTFSIQDKAGKKLAVTKSEALYKEEQGKTDFHLIEKDKQSFSVKIDATTKTAKKIPYFDFV